MRIFILSLLFIVVLTTGVTGQNNYGIYWQRALGGTGLESMKFFYKTNDNCVLAIGTTSSVNFNSITNHGSLDILAVKLTMEGSIVWQKCFGGPQAESLTSYYYDSTDGTSVIVGSSGAVGGDITVNHGSTDGWVIKIDNSGNLLWQKSIGGSSVDNLYSIIKTASGDYVVYGYTFSNDGDISGNHGSYDLWLCKLTSSGSLLWNRCYGGSLLDGPGNYDNNRALFQAADGNYVFAGSVSSANGDVTGNQGSTDIWVVKADATNGAIIWQKCIGGVKTEALMDMRQMSSGEIYVYGNTNSPELPNFHNPAQELNDLYLAKLSSTGNLTWQKCFGEDQNDVAFQIEETADNAVVISGTIKGNGGDVSGWHGADDIWIAKIKSDASIAWQRCLGGSNGEGMIADNFIFVYRSVGGFKKTMDNGFLITGVSSSNDGDVTGNHDPGVGVYGAYFHGDEWLVKLDSAGNLQWQRCLGGSQLDGPASSAIALDNGGYIIGGNVGSNDGNANGSHANFFLYADMWLCRLDLASTIKGNVYIDYNGNLVHDPGEPFFSHTTVKSEKPGFINTSISSKGSFSNDVDTGHYSTVCLPFKNYYTITPVSKTSIFPSYGLVDSFDFALKPIPAKRDLGIAISSLFTPRVGSYSTYTILYENEGTATIPSGNVVFIKDSRTTFISASPTYNSISGDTIRWNFNNFQPLDTASIGVALYLQTPPVLNINDTLHYYAEVNPQLNDEDPSDNVNYLNQVVRASRDPNDKTEMHEGEITRQQVDKGEWLQYLVRFQNTGTDTAFSVVVKDTLDSKLDWSTLQMIESSHAYTMNVKDNRFCSWAFNDIKLPDIADNEPSSHGYLLYRIKPKAGTPTGDMIRNKAAIYFDYNMPVITNTQVTLIKDVTVIAGSGADELYVVDVYPQPAREKINIRFKRNLSGRMIISLLDAKGSLVFKEDKGMINTNGLSIPVWINTLPKGVYFLMVSLNAKTVETKIVIE